VSPRVDGTAWYCTAHVHSGRVRVLEDTVNELREQGGVEAVLELRSALEAAEESGHALRERVAALEAELRKERESRDDVELADACGFLARAVAERDVAIARMA
jgi:hypothetical protein